VSDEKLWGDRGMQTWDWPETEGWGLPHRASSAPSPTTRPVEPVPATDARLLQFTLPTVAWVPSETRQGTSSDPTPVRVQPVVAEPEHLVVTDEEVAREMQPEGWGTGSPLRASGSRPTPQSQGDYKPKVPLPDVRAPEERAAPAPRPEWTAARHGEGSARGTRG